MMPDNRSPRVLIVGIILLLSFSLLLNLLHIHLREFQGEEGRRVMIAKNMLENGNWVVPYFEGKIYLNKPPLYNWFLACIFRLTGTISETTARITSVIAASLSAVCLGIFWRKIAKISSSWYILPGLIFLTFTDVMDKSIRAEIDMTFTFFIVTALVVWFYCFEGNKKELQAWVLALALVGLGTLAKGIQAPAFFYCAVFPYLIYQRRLKAFFSFQHLTGVIAFLVIFSVWFIPFINQVDISEVIQAWKGEILARKEPLNEGGFFRHLVEFPFQFLIAYLPWFPFLVLWIRNPLAKEPAILKDLTRFCLLALVVSLPIYWLLPGARLRYIMPLAGNLAILIAVPVHAIISGKIGDSILIRRYLQVLGIVVILALLTAPYWAQRFSPFEHPLMVFSFAIPTFLLGLSFIRQKRSMRQNVVHLVLFTLLVKLSWASVYLPYHNIHLSHYRTAAAQINTIVPPHANLYDYKVNNGHLAYYLQRPVTLIHSLKEITQSGNSFIYTERVNAPEIDAKELLYIGSVKARRKHLVLYQVADLFNNK